MINDLRELSSELVVLSARLVREIRRNSPLLPAASTRVLSLLDELGPSTVSALAASDGCSQPTMTGTVTGLVDKNLVERTPHPDDARSSLISMTPAGRRTLADVRRTNATVVAERIAASGRTPEELATAVAVLNDLIEPREKKD
jgi:DNA-binding MarR family transcriptional regulator